MARRGLSVSRILKPLPVGSIIFWHQNFAGTPTLPAGWVLCNGILITDGRSPYVGQSTPLLSSGQTCFWRGSNTSSGPFFTSLHQHNINSATAPFFNYILQVGSGGYTFNTTADFNDPPAWDMVPLMRIF